MLYFHIVQLVENLEIHDFRRFFEMFLNRPWMYAKEPIYAFLISLFVGFIFVEIPNDQRASINTRFGFIISILAIFMLPNHFIHIERGYCFKFTSEVIVTACDPSQIHNIDIQLFTI